MSNKNTETREENTQSLFLRDSENRRQVEQNDGKAQMELSRACEVSRSMGEADFDDLFEGEPDWDLLMPANSDNPVIVGLGPVAAWLASSESVTKEPQMSLNEQSLPDHSVAFPIASGGLGNGDLPFQESVNGKRHQMQAAGPGARELEVKDFKDHPDYTLANTQGMLQAPMYQQCQSLPSDSMATDNTVRRVAHSASLSREVFGRHKNHYDIYSATGSSESISVHDEAVEEDTVPQMPPSQAQQAQPNAPSSTECRRHDLLETEQLTAPEVDVASSQSIQPALQQFKPYLSEMTTASTQGQHLTKTPRSSHSSKSHASCLVDELDAEKDLWSSLKDAERGTENCLDVKISASAYTDSTAKATTTFSDQTNNVPLPLQQFDLTHPLPAKQINSTASRTEKDRARWKIPTSSAPPRDLPSIDLQCDSSGHGLAIQISDMPASPNKWQSAASGAQNLAVHETQHHNVAYLDNSTRSINGIRSEKQASGVPGLATTLGKDISERSDQGVLLDDSNTAPQHDMLATEVSDTIATLLLEPRDNPHPALQAHQSWQGLTLAPKGPETILLDLQGSDVPTAQTTNDINMSRPYSPKVALSVQTTCLAPSLTLLVGLQDAIYVARRGTRKLNAPKQPAVAKATNPEGRAISFQSAKRKAFSGTKSAPAAGAQGESTKIAKERTTGTSRGSSRKLAATLKGKRKKHEDIPDVPGLPMDMDLDLPDVQLQPRGSQKHQDDGADQVIGADRRELETELILRQETPPVGSVREEAHGTSQALSHASHKPATPPRKVTLILRVPKTRNQIKSKSATALQVVDPRSDDTVAAITTQVSKHTCGASDINPDQQPLSTSSQRPTADNQPIPSTLPSEQQRTRRTTTPYKVQKLTTRKLRTPAPPIPTINAGTMTDPEQSDATNVPISTTTPSVSKPSTPKSKPKPRPTPTTRKATPAAKKRKPSPKTKKVDEDIIVPPLPTTILNRRSLGGGPTQVTIAESSTPTGNTGSLLTPQSAAAREKMGSPVPSPSPSPLWVKRSARLSGLGPGPGLYGPLDKRMM